MPDQGRGAIWCLETPDSAQRGNFAMPLRQPQWRFAAHFQGITGQPSTGGQPSVARGVCDRTFVRPLQGRMERVLGLPWAAQKLPRDLPMAVV
jgi:hypothetical protein